MSDKNNRYIATFILHALGDTIGFKNGEWEFNYDNKHADYRTTLVIVFDFIALGGITNISLKDWLISDDTLFHLSIAESLLKVNLKDKLTDNQIKEIRDCMVKTLEDIEIDDKKNIFRGVGRATVYSLKNKDVPFFALGGNGVAMRSLCIGLAYHKTKDINKLVEYSIETGKLTHKNPIGYLGGLTTAYFTHLAINNIKLELWPLKLIELVESPIVEKYIDKNNFEIYSNYRLFISLWKKYIELRFKPGEKKDNLEPIYTNSHKNLISRTKFFYDFKFNYDDYEFIPTSQREGEAYNTICGSGVTAVLMAYDALLDAGDNWEKLIYYAMLHVGDSDTVGAIAGGLYGAIYGLDKVPNRLLDNIEKKDEIIEMSKKIYKKYN